VSVEEEEARVQEEEATTLKKEAQAQLDEALPMLDEATKVLRELKKDDLFFLNSINTPTPNVIKVMELSCYMFQLKPGKPNIGKV
jgi:dynein heavy chain